MFCAIKLSKSDPTPLYIQLSNELAKLIQMAILPSGTKLPTIRSLSRKLKINRDTVVSAYKILELQGLVIAQVGSGTYVSPLSNTTTYDDTETTNITCSSLTFQKAFFSSDIALELTKSILSREGWCCFSDPLYRERSILKQVICDFLKSVGITPSPAEVRLIKDNFSFINTLCRLSTKNGFCIEAYSDLTYSAYLRSLGIKVYEVPLQSDGMDLDALEKHLKFHNIGYIWLSSYLQNPTGICYSEEKKNALIQLANKYDFYIIEDGTFNDFVYNYCDLHPIYQLDTTDRTIFFFNFSKLYFPQLNYSFFILPNTLIKKLPDSLECTFNEYLFHEYLESDFFYSLREKLLVNTYNKYLLITSEFKKLDSQFQIFSTCGGIVLWVKCLSCDMLSICEQLADAHIIVAPGTLFTTANTCDFFRISLSTLTPEDILQITKLLTSL